MSARGESELWRPKGIISVLDTSTLVRAWLSREDNPNPARNVMRLAGQAYDSFTSPVILGETEEVLVRPRFGASRGHVQQWLDAFLRMSRQVFPETIPGSNPATVGGDEEDQGGDEEDLPVLNTAYAASASGGNIGETLAMAQNDGGRLLVLLHGHRFAAHQTLGLAPTYVAAVAWIKAHLRVDRFRNVIVQAITARDPTRHRHRLAPPRLPASFSPPGELEGSMPIFLQYSLTDTFWRYHAIFRHF